MNGSGGAARQRWGSHLPTVLFSFVMGAAIFAMVSWWVRAWPSAVSVRDTWGLTLSHLWWVLSGVESWQAGRTHLGTDFSSLHRGPWAVTLRRFRGFRSSPRSCLSGSHHAG